MWWFFIRGGQRLSETLITPTPFLGQRELNLLKQSSSDEVSDIKKDLRDTDLNNLDKELADIEGQLL